MTTRNDVLKQLQTDLKEKLKRMQGYNTDPVTILRGNVIFEDAKVLPGLSFYMDSDEVLEHELDPTAARVLNIVIILYVDTLNEDHDQLHNFIEDIESFLSSSDWTYSNSTLIGEIVVDEFGTTIPNVSFGMINCQVFYQKE